MFKGLKSFRFYFIFFLISLFAVFLISGCSSNHPEKIENKTIKDVKLQTVNESNLPKYLEASGTVKAKIISVITSKVMGTITSINVKDGDRVSEGEVLLTIYDQDASERVRQAEKNLDAAKLNLSLSNATYMRYKALYDEKALSQQEMDQITTQKELAQTNYERAKAALEEARVMRSFYTVTSPISGIVSSKKVDVGTTAMPGMPLLNVENTSSFELDANVDSKYSQDLKVGSPVKVKIDSMPEIEGKISEIVPSVDPMSRSFVVKVDLGSGNFKSGMYGKAYFNIGTKRAVVIPETAIVRKGGLIGVYVVDDKGIVSYRMVKLGETYKNTVEVLSGLSNGERIIVEGTENAFDGAIVKGS
ncbi:efflux transporter, RND family, MFP subunit [Thermodesulfobium narugense DSM 14796]|uniref:Efflux transporter, RND family, MFP subunit n=1 Tax=Thermodesulfobium narugense DSM 14796 TaxID=747365 RepID=M1E672_9BACT|nr:efflux RND transporter periplasmic adaptor subunit [Thermodesulfobium narugense]AEE14666.1 efflux transporter, RND family, MFP subunit [Thermodesulfobium narugense DSM 14796]